MKPLRILLLAVLSIATVLSNPAYSDSPALEYLKRSIASLQQVLRDPNLAGDGHLIERRKLARAVLEQVFEFQEMSRRSLGANARRYRERLPEFTPLFVDFLGQAYMKIIEDNGDAKIEYLGELVNGENVEIRTKARLKDGSAYSINYRLFLSPAGWRVYDVIMEEISLVNNYRSQFDRILSKKSFDGLLQDLRDKNDTSH